MSTVCQSTCAGTEQMAFRLSMTRTYVVACAEHAAWLTGQGLVLVPDDRRKVAVPVASDRRRFVARWVANLTASDRTGALR